MVSPGARMASISDGPFSGRVVAAFLTLFLLGGCADPGPDHLLILGDPHLPGKNLAAKEEVLARINSWPDIDLVIAVGDLTSLYGSAEEYAAAGAFFRKLHHPLAPVAGNHDTFYLTPHPPTSGGYQPAPWLVREEKLQRFRRTFALEHHYYSRQIGPYLLLFLSADHPTFGSGIAESQLIWLRNQLILHRDKPTIIVTHAPLFGTQTKFRRYINRPSAIAQPAARLHTILISNPQVFLWVSGHTHTPPTEPSYASFINLYAKRITNIHNKDMKGETIWTNSLYLYPDRVEVRTYNHRERRWQAEFERRIPSPLP